MSEMTRILVVTDTADPAPALLHALEAKAARGHLQVRLVVLNPARAEVHFLHPERHTKAAEAEEILHRNEPRIEAAIGARVFGSVSVRHDPMDAVEETLASEPVDEIMLHVREHRLARRLHQDLPHRLAHYGLPITMVDHEQAQAHSTTTAARP